MLIRVTCTEWVAARRKKQDESGLVSRHVRNLRLYLEAVRPRPLESKQRRKGVGQRAVE
jgi:hypothetical protein